MLNRYETAQEVITYFEGFIREYLCSKLSIGLINKWDYIDPDLIEENINLVAKARLKRFENLLNNLGQVSKEVAVLTIYKFYIEEYKSANLPGDFFWMLEKKLVLLFRQEKRKYPVEKNKQEAILKKGIQKIESNILVNYFLSKPCQKLTPNANELRLSQRFLTDTVRNEC